ncbi:ATP-binding protein [Sorangium sp. So ce131]|uniref:ATP-binding protein n=1 Tax=Sorangium sp. So ce131 TaxID=3133282 RepID=UPI003F6142CB
MNDLERWHSFNDVYLSDALAWLRARLEHLEPQGKPPEAPPEAPPNLVPRPVPPARPRSLRGRLLDAIDSVRDALPAETAAEGRTEGARAPDRHIPMPASMADAERAEAPPALVVLARRLGLTDFERFTLLLCAAMELDTRIGPLCARAQQDATKPFPTFALALALFDDPAWEIVSPERPLRHFRLIEINQPGAQPLLTSAIKADERIVNYLKGLNYLDDRLAPLLMPVRTGTTLSPPSQLVVVEGIANHLQRLGDGAPAPVVQLLGADGPSKLLIANQAAARLGLTLYRISADAIPAPTGDHETFVRIWQRECMILPLALYVDARDLDRAGSPQAAIVRRFLMRQEGVVFLDVRDAWHDVGREGVQVDVVKPTPLEQEVAWAAALGGEGSASAAQLAGQFSFDLQTIESIAAATGARLRDGREGLPERLWAESLRRARPALDQLAQPLEPKATWDDLALPAAEQSLLRQIAGQVKARRVVYDGWGFRQRMNRGFGISVLFAGESGTGKTMAAEVIANDLGLWLHRIDLSAVVSKYIGETEKNLRRLFDAAEDGGSILFFDEADALFGKRSEIKDSHDRYANIEINYLLQRMEAYRGLAILATNMRSALDGAFVRRLRFIVNFPFPTQVERTAIWRRAFPAETPVSGLDFQRLARFNLAGGSIHNIAVNAAFLAAQAGTPVSMPLVLEAARIELRKLDKPINEADFRYVEAAGSGV